MNDFFGLGGALLLAACWIPQIFHLVRSGRAEGISLGFSLMMCGASSLLTVHAFHIHSPVFAAVNAFAAVMAALQVVLVLRYR